MSEIVAIVEGKTEQTFVRDVVAPHLGVHGMTMWAVLCGKTGKQGGVKKWTSARSDIARVLKQGRYCTTMFDYYAMPTDWPGREESARHAAAERGPFIESRIVAELATTLESAFDRRQFIPYVQMHEFEAVLFSDPDALARGVAASSDDDEVALSLQFRQIVNQIGDPEAINDDYETCPSRRIANLVPRYKKAIHGPIIAQRIGLETIREKCQHFTAWISRLEELA